jgi:hypothetical protein
MRAREGIVGGDGPRPPSPRWVGRGGWGGGGRSRTSRTSRTLPRHSGVGCRLDETSRSRSPPAVCIPASSHPRPVRSGEGVGVRTASAPVRPDAERRTNQSRSGKATRGTAKSWRRGAAGNSQMLSPHGRGAATPSAVTSGDTARLSPAWSAQSATAPASRRTGVRPGTPTTSRPYSTGGASHGSHPGIPPGLRSASPGTIIGAQT